jgi:O-methyltransferase
MENETPGLRAVLRKIEALAVLVWTWQPGIMKRHTSFQGVLPLVVWLAFGVILYIPASKVLQPLIYNQLNRVPVSPVPIAVAVKTSPAPSTPEKLYLDLLKKTLTRAQTVGRYTRRTLLGAGRFEISELVPTNPSGYLEAGGARLEMRQDDAETMVGTKQLDNIQFCITDVLKRRIPGDVIECGAWRGGVTILMRAVLRAYGDTEKTVWVADSFEGLPRPITRVDSGLEQGMMAVSLEEVQENFARYGLLDERVRFLKGYFNKTLPTAPIVKLSVLRADSDLYGSQMDVLNNLYPKLSVGGYAIIDDYFELAGCQRAIDEYRQAHNITEEIKRIDSEGIYWQKLH